MTTETTITIKYRTDDEATADAVAADHAAVLLDAATAISSDTRVSSGSVDRSNGQVEHFDFSNG